MVVSCLRLNFSIVGLGSSNAPVGFLEERK